MPRWGRDVSPCSASISPAQPFGLRPPRTRWQILAVVLDERVCALPEQGIAAGAKAVQRVSQEKLHEESKADAPEQANDGRSRYYEHSTRGSVIRRNVPFLMRN
jgi:hypothetical protein